MSSFQFALLWMAVPLGAAVGSFAAALDSRWQPGKPWRELLVQNSHCSTCGSSIAWRDNIPVISWLILKGRARCCGSNIGSKTLVAELIGMIALAALSLGIQEAYGLWGWLAIISTLLLQAGGFAVSLALALIDARTGLLPNRLVLSLILLSLGFAAIQSADQGSLQPVLTGAGSSLIWFAVFWLLRVVSRGGMGQGDIKLAAAIGLWLGAIGPEVSSVGFFLAFGFGAIQGLAFAALRGGGMKQRIPFGPAMLAGWLAAGAFGNQIWNGYLNLVSDFVN